MLSVRYRAQSSPGLDWASPGLDWASPGLDWARQRTDSNAAVTNCSVAFDRSLNAPTESESLEYTLAVPHIASG